MRKTLKSSVIAVAILVVLQFVVMGIVFGTMKAQTSASLDRILPGAGSVYEQAVDRGR